MTIFVTWQSRVTLDSIRNSCDVFTELPGNFTELPQRFTEQPGSLEVRISVLPEPAEVIQSRKLSSFLVMKVNIIKEMMTFRLCQCFFPSKVKPLLSSVNWRTPTAFEFGILVRHTTQREQTDWGLASCPKVRLFWSKNTSIQGIAQYFHVRDVPGVTFIKNWISQIFCQCWIWKKFFFWDATIRSKSNEIFSRIKTFRWNLTEVYFWRVVLFSCILK